MSFLVIFLCVSAIGSAAGKIPPRAWAPDGAPELLLYDELMELSAAAPAGEALERKLQQLLETPIVSNAAARSGARPKRPRVERLGNVARAAFWNLERGYNLDLMLRSLRLPAELPNGADPDKLALASRQASLLADSDILILNELDLGVSRSDYRNVAAELAAELHMNYAFAVEFVEVDPLLLGIEEPGGEPDAVQQWKAAHPVRAEKFRGLHGNGILSRYPILDARVVRLPDCYDWYAGEKRAVAELEKGRRWTARRVFEERISRETRRGGRMALIVDLEAPEAPGGVITAVSTHLENRCRPACRQDQFDAVMDSVAAVANSVVIGGDLNTSGTNAAPTSIAREVTRRATSLKFWLEMGVRYLTPVSIPQLGILPANHFKNFQDPTVFHLPLFLPNRERGLFTRARRFRFDDGGRFDFGGDRARTGGRRGGTLAASNQRGLKGFRPTFSFERTFRGLFGRYKLDWFFVKPAADGALAPHFPVTMNELNEIAGDRMSDHPPLTVDLPLGPPPRLR